ncbi:MAG: XdhC family protein, partial [Mesorhizobium sp.]
MRSLISASRWTRIRRAWSTHADGLKVAREALHSHMFSPGETVMENSIYLDEARDPLIIAEGWMKDGKDVAIATVVETWGSAPRPVGSHLVIDAEGNFHGSVSG